VKTNGCRPHDKCVAKHLKPWTEQLACLCAPMCTPIHSSIAAVNSTLGLYVA